VRLAPAERIDVVVDFAGRQDRQIVIENDGLPIMRFRVSRAAVSDPSVFPKTLRPVDVLKESDGAQTRIHGLSEDDDMLARPMRMLLNRTRWHMPVTEQRDDAALRRRRVIEPPNITKFYRRARRDRWEYST
jgi:spore coat protein A